MMIDAYFDNIFVQIIAASMTSFGFAIIYNIKGKLFIHGGVAGAISWLIYLLGKKAGLGVGVVFFLATVSLSLYAEIMSRRCKITVTAILIPALIPLAPGSGIYYAIYNLIHKNYPLALEKGITTFIMAGSMAVGIFAVANIMRIYERNK